MNVMSKDSQQEHINNLENTICKVQNALAPEGKQPAKTLIRLSDVGFCWGHYEKEEGCLIEADVMSSSSSPTIATEPAATATADNDHESEREEEFCKLRYEDALRSLQQRLEKEKEKLYSNAGSSKEQIKSSSSLSLKQTPKSSGTGTPVNPDIFEIREYIDDSGALTNHELLNVTKSSELIAELDVAQAKKDAKNEQKYEKEPLNNHYDAGKTVEDDEEGEEEGEMFADWMSDEEIDVLDAPLDVSTAYIALLRIHAHAHAHAHVYIKTFLLFLYLF